MDLFCATETCPVCHVAGMVFALVRRDTSQGLYYCPACGCAWPGNGAFDSGAAPDAIEVVAPTGVRLPQPHELPPDVVAAPPEDIALWAPYLREVLTPPT